jgi:hypothetical protein
MPLIPSSPPPAIILLLYRSPGTLQVIDTRPAYHEQGDPQD